ncbi:hypothetical protein SLE2022_295520 [Rubroshorea leprosula]
MVRGDDYKFLKIRDAITSINQKVNLIGIILEFGSPQKSKGSDYFCKLKIIDESYKDGIPVHVFAESMEMLPCITSSGDIIQLSRVMMKIHANDVYAIFNKKFSSFALYNGKDGESFLPYQSSPRFHQREQDKKLIAGLRKWLDDSKCNEGFKTNFLLLREIQDACRVNLACKVLHLCEIGNGWMVFLWDGTDAPSVTVIRKLEDEMANQLPLHLEPLPLSRDVLCTLPTVGTILRVIIKPEYGMQVLHLLEIGKWVKVLNMICEVHAGLWRGVFTTSTRLQNVPEDDVIVQGHLSLLDERLSFKLGRMPYWSFPWPSEITVVDYDGMAFATLMDVLTYPEVTAKFKCVVRFVAAFPWRVEDFRSPRGTYRIRFTLEDPTARVHAFVYAEDGEKFFDGVCSTDELGMKFNKLLGIDMTDDGKQDKNAGRNPPWVQCCLKSYYLDKSNKWGSRQFRIFETKLVG